MPVCVLSLKRWKFLESAMKQLKRKKAAAFLCKLVLKKEYERMKKNICS